MRIVILRIIVSRDTTIGHITAATKQCAPLTLLKDTPSYFGLDKHVFTEPLVGRDSNIIILFVSIMP